MKYHYKSPEELEERAERRDREVRGKRNRGNLVIFADLFVICLIFAGIYYSGALRPERYVSDATVRLDNLEYSGSVELSADANAPLVFYLNVKLLGEQAMVFPRVEISDAQSSQATAAPAGTAREIKATIEILGREQEQAKQRTVRFSAEYPLGLRTIRPGETTIYRAELRIPGGTGDLKKGDTRIRIRAPFGAESDETYLAL